VTDPSPLEGCSICRRSNPCNGFPSLPFIDARGGHKGKGKMSYNVWSLGRPVVRRCPSGRIETELCRLVVGAATWPGRAIQHGTLGASSE
jgi:hypothetical protein